MEDQDKRSFKKVSPKSKPNFSKRKLTKTFQREMVNKYFKNPIKIKDDYMSSTQVLSNHDFEVESRAYALKTTQEDKVSKVRIPKSASNKILSKKKRSGLRYKLLGAKPKRSKNSKLSKKDRLSSPIIFKNRKGNQGMSIRSNAQNKRKILSDTYSPKLKKKSNNGLLKNSTSQQDIFFGVLQDHLKTVPDKPSKKHKLKKENQQLKHLSKELIEILVESNKAKMVRQILFIISINTRVDG